MFPVSVSDQCLRDHFVLIFIFKLSVLSVSHHEEVTLEFLLLSGVKLAFLVVTVIFFLFSVLGCLTLFVIFFIVAETCLVGLITLLVWHAPLSITNGLKKEGFRGKDRNA